jgi:putative FmdB family regulatory protein
MPRYEYRCRSCDEVFELRRSMSDSDAPAFCPQGHAETSRLLSVFATVGASSSGSTGGASAADAAPPAGGPCGGACACYPG